MYFQSITDLYLLRRCFESSHIADVPFVCFFPIRADPIPLGANDGDTGKKVFDVVCEFAAGGRRNVDRKKKLNNDYGNKRFFHPASIPKLARRPVRGTSNCRHRFLSNEHQVFLGYLHPHERAEPVCRFYRPHHNAFLTKKSKRIDIFGLMFFCGKCFRFGSLTHR